MADKSRIKQVMINLLDNALKYSEKGSSIQVFITQDTARHTATVEVKDFGKGIHPDETNMHFDKLLIATGSSPFIPPMKGLEKVKDKFYKGRGAKRGSGIGLALVNEIITLHDGRFDIESEYGKYTSMRFTLKTVRTMKGK